jgi:ATP-dependent DNA helicase DinG
MQALHRALARTSRRPILVQGEAPKTVLLEKFRRAPNAVLVATMSFWEGVDVPGKALRLVIIDKIPFQVPTDPVVLARSAAIEALGKNPFAHYHVPSAAITLKQGFGRLIRSQKDAGIVALLDKRVHTKGYGRTLLESLPPAKRTDDLSETKAFAARLAHAQD